MKAVKVKDSTERSNASKVGTWISVGVVGLAILLTYFLLFGIYMDRV
ncbi:hypothetical protein [Thalassobacillus hwangdonensis]|uniref:Cytochrome c oxidase subunit 2A n=1 Tax=Thalassobacillus hwangdonensis TaxID=546108 RepID=A0ABW3L0F5_9BACI